MSKRRWKSAAANRDECAARIAHLAAAQLVSCPPGSSERLSLRVLPNQCVPRIISLLSELTLGSKDGARPHSGMLLDCLRSVAEVWSGSSHVRSAPLRTQRYLTQLLVEGIPALRPTTLASELVHVLLSGVQHHLQAPDEAYRRLGMRVAEVVSRVIDPNNPLDFDARSSDDEADDETAENVHGMHTMKASASTTASTPLAAGSRAADERANAQEIRAERRQMKASSRNRAEVEEQDREADEEDEDGDEDEEDPDAPARLPGMSDGSKARQHRAQAAAKEDGGNDNEEAESYEIPDGLSESDADSDSSYEALDTSDDRATCAASLPRHLRRLLTYLRAKQGEHERGGCS